MEIAEGLVVSRLLVEWPCRLEYVGTPIHGHGAKGSIRKENFAGQFGEYSTYYVLVTTCSYIISRSSRGSDMKPTGVTCFEGELAQIHHLDFVKRVVK